MKRALFLSIISLACFASSLAADRLTVSDVKVKEGMEASIDIGCELQTACKAYQMDVELGSGYTLKLDAAGNPVTKCLTSTDHAVYSRRVSDGKYRFVVVSMKGQQLPKSGSLLRMTVAAPSSAKAGSSITGRVRSIEFTTAQTTPLRLSDTSFKVTVVGQPPKGDVNDDSAINVADIASVIDVMAGSADVSSALADVNGDGTVNVADIAAIIDIMAGSYSDISRGLVAYYPFNGNANDESGNGNHGTPMSSVKLTKGLHGDDNGAYRFGGIDNPGHIHVPNSESLKFTDGATFSAYFKVSSWVSMDGHGNRQESGAAQCLIGKSHDTVGWEICCSGNDEGISFWAHSHYWDDSWGDIVTNPLTGNYLNRWTHVAVTFGNGRARLYVDGELTLEKESKPDFSETNGEDLFFGKFSDEWYPFNGVLDEIRIYNRALNGGEVKELAKYAGSYVIEPGGDDTPSYTSCPDNNHPHLIDLGLPSGTKWACCNVGASKPEEYGDYFAWGETQPKEVYKWDTYIHCDGSKDNCHDLGSNIAGTKYDAATANWKAPWRMPTWEQCKELKDNCTSEWTTQNDVKGWKFTGPNDCTVFLPAAASRRVSGLEGLLGGYYWSSTLYESTPNRARYLLFNSGGVSMRYQDRYYGFTVRPVR